MSTYTIVNAGVAVVVKKIEVDGAPATVNQERLIVEMVPDDGFSGTVKLVLPPSEASAWPAGSKVEAQFTVIGE